MKLPQEPNDAWPSTTAREALDAYRAALASPPDAEAQNLQAVLARADAGDPGPLPVGRDEADPPEGVESPTDELVAPLRPRSRRWPLAVGVALAIAAALLLIVLGPGSAGHRARPGDPSAASDHPDLPEPERARLRGGAASDPRPSTTTAADPVVHAPPAPALEPAPGARTPTPPKRPLSPPPRPPSTSTDPAPASSTGAGADAPEGEGADALRREAALVRRIRRALDDGDPSGALPLVDEHRREFPRGAMTEERDAFAAIALCRVDRQRQGRALALALLAARPRTIHADALREACELDP